MKARLEYIYKNGKTEQVNILTDPKNTIPGFIDYCKRCVVPDECRSFRIIINGMRSGKIPMRKSSLN